MNPYIDNDDIRTFSKSVDEMELIWHRDREDRKITVLEGRDWKLQMDNELPVSLEVGKTYFIPKLFFHRVLKGTTDLKIRIEEC